VELREFFAGVSECEAEYKSSTEEWSAKETLVHLIDSEGYRLDFVTEVLADGQREFAGGDGQSDYRPCYK